MIFALMAGTLFLVLDWFYLILLAPDCIKETLKRGSKIVTKSHGTFWRELLLMMNEVKKQLWGVNRIICWNALISDLTPVTYDLLSIESLCSHDEWNRNWKLFRVNRRVLKWSSKINLNIVNKSIKFSRIYIEFVEY